MLSWRLIRRFVTALLAVALVLSALLLIRNQDSSPLADSPAADAPAADAPSLPAPETTEPAPPVDKAPKPVVRTKETVVPKAPVGAAKDVVAELPETRTASYGMVGVTWSAKTTERDISVAIRSLVKDQWTPWQTLELDDEAPGEPGRPGTEPIWVGKAEGVAVRVSSASGTRPDDIKVMTIDPGGANETADATVTPAVHTTSGIIDGTAHVSTAASVADGAPTFTAPPTIIARPAWGAAAGGTCSAPIAGFSTRGIVVHHTAGSNTYTAAQSAQLVRGVQAYHVKGHGWCDIGYNFLVDKFGQIFEGRKGGVDRSVRGAHAGNGEVNTYAMGISMMGNFDTAVPPEALKAAMVKLVGWRMGTNFMKAKGTWKVAEKNLTLNLIAGHRNVVGTACPGEDAYEWLSESGGLRDRVEAYIASYSSEIKTRAAALSATAKGPLYIGEAEVTAASGAGRRAQFGFMDILSKPGKGARIVALSGGFRARYVALGAQDSPLWFPIGDSPAATTNGVYPQRFENGSLFAVRIGNAISVQAIWGPSATVYASLGEAAGKLGTPTASLVAEAGGLKMTFVKGYIRYTTATNKAVAYDTAGNPLTSGGTTPPTPPASGADAVTIPSSRLFNMRGHGYGHGIGMSQYGAQGAAKMGAKYDAILGFYYPGTALGSHTGNIRILISKDWTASVIVDGRSGLYFRKMSDNKPILLPTQVSGKTVSQWQIVPLAADPKKSTIQYKTTGSFGTFAGVTWAGDAQFEAATLKLHVPGGSATYRGALRSAAPTAGSTDRNTVNHVPVESYVRGVVAAEMPSSWMPEALKAQAVAARTYGVRGIVTSRYYDMCDTSSCQVYRGVASETANTDAAVAATNGKIVTYQGSPAFTQFSSSSGGWTVAGSRPYLVSKFDPYDGKPGNPVHSWAGAVNASFFERAYPAIGSLVSIRVTKRTGGGEWGGRVATVSLVGSKSTISITGAALRSSIGLRSAWFAMY